MMRAPRSYWGLEGGPVWRVAFWILLSGALAAPALADDWSARTRFNQSVEVSDNRALNPTPAGETALFTSQLMLDAVSRLRNMTFEINADVSYQNLTGPGADQNASPTDNSLNLRFENRLDELTTFDLRGFWQRQDATSAQLADTGIVIATGDINTYTLESGIRQQVNPYDELRWSTRGTVVDFSSDPDASFADLLTTGAWVRRLTPTSALTNTLQLEGVFHDDPANTQAWIARATTGLETPITSHLTFKGTLGASFHSTSHDYTPANIPATSSTSETGVDGLGDLTLIYLFLPTTQMTLSASHWTGPNVLGEIESRTMFAAGVRHAINQASSLSVGSDYTGQIPIIGIFDDGDASYVRAFVGYDYRLTQDWIAQASYRYAYRVSDAEAPNPYLDAGSASSNTIFFSAVYEATILP